MKCLSSRGRGHVVWNGVLLYKYLAFLPLTDGLLLLHVKIISYKRYIFCCFLLFTGLKLSQHKITSVQQYSLFSTKTVTSCFLVKQRKTIWLIQFIYYFVYLNYPAGSTGSTGQRQTDLPSVCFIKHHLTVRLILKYGLYFHVYEEKQSFIICGHVHFRNSLRAAASLPKRWASGGSDTHMTQRQEMIISAPSPLWAVAG